MGVLDAHRACCAELGRFRKDPTCKEPHSHTGEENWLMEGG